MRFFSASVQDPWVKKSGFRKPGPEPACFQEKRFTGNRVGVQIPCRRSAHLPLDQCAQCLSVVRFLVSNSGDLGNLFLIRVICVYPRRVLVFPTSLRSSPTSSALWQHRARRGQAEAQKAIAATNIRGSERTFTTHVCSQVAVWKVSNCEHKAVCRGSQACLMTVTYSHASCVPGYMCVSDVETCELMIPKSSERPFSRSD